MHSYRTVRCSKRINPKLHWGVPLILIRPNVDGDTSGSPEEIRRGVNQPPKLLTHRSPTHLTSQIVDGAMSAWFQLRRAASRPHLAIVPLANVGWSHASGDLLGFGVVLPRGITAAERDHVLHTFGRFAPINEDSEAYAELRLSSSVRWRVERTVAPSRASLKPARWCRAETGLHCGGTRRTSSAGHKMKGTSSLHWQYGRVGVPAFRAPARRHKHPRHRNRSRPILSARCWACSTRLVYSVQSRSA
jgi:hypothetical protein